jgi:predicted GNAT family acetyltransferase
VEAAALLLVEFNQNMPRKVTMVNARQLVKKSVEDKQMYRAVIDGQMKAFVVVARHTPGAKAVSNVYTAPAARGKGLAETLVRYTVKS